MLFILSVADLEGYSLASVLTNAQKFIFPYNLKFIHIFERILLMS